MVAVGNDHRPGPPAVGGIDELAVAACLFPHPFHRRRFRRDNGNHPVPHDAIVKPDIHDAAHGLFDILDLFPDPVDLAFHLNDTLGDIDIPGFLADRVDFPLKLLGDEIEPPAHLFFQERVF